MKINEVHVDKPKNKNTVDWYMSLINSVTHLEKQLKNARKEIQQADLPDDKVAALQKKIVKYQQLVAMMNDDIEELSDEAFSQM